MYALVAAAALAAAFGELADATVVLAVVVLNALIGFVQEYRAGRAIAALAELVAEPALVRRDGAWIELPAELVVPGDVLSVGQGDRVTADVRLLSAERLRAQESVLTGESAPVDKHPRAVPRAAVAGRSPQHPARGHRGGGRNRSRRGRRDGARHRGGEDLRAAGRGRPAADPAHARARPARPDGHRRHRRRGPADRRRGGGARVPGRRRRAGGHQPRRRRGAGGAAGGRHDRARHRRAAHGAPPRDRPPSPRRRDARLHHGRGVGQDRHPDAQPDDGPGIVDARGRGSATTCSWRASCATTPRPAAGRRRPSAIPPRSRCSTTPRRRASTRRPRAPRTPGWTPCRSTPGAS